MVFTFEVLYVMTTLINIIMVFCFLLLWFIFFWFCFCYYEKKRRGRSLILQDGYVFQCLKTLTVWIWARIIDDPFIFTCEIFFQIFMWLSIYYKSDGGHEDHWRLKIPMDIYGSDGVMFWWCCCVLWAWIRRVRS